MLARIRGASAELGKMLASCTRLRLTSAWTELEIMLASCTGTVYNVHALD